jgi:hypothetical protein
VPVFGPAGFAGPDARVGRENRSATDGPEE